MKKPTISTIIIIIAIVIIALYAAGEVNYYSAKIIHEQNYDSPVVVIEKVGINEKINNISIDEGVYFEPQSHVPTHGEVVIFGHRTMQGSPFLRLNELEPGDIITLEWPGIGEINYTVNNTKIVPASYVFQASNTTQKIDLITCDPIGSTANRLIIEGCMTSVGPVKDKIIEDNPLQYHAIIIIAIFLVVGLALAYFYPEENRIYILVTVLVITAILVYFYFFPIPSEIIYSKIGWINGGFLEG